MLDTRDTEGVVERVGAVVDVRTVELVVREGATEGDVLLVAVVIAVRVAVVAAERVAVVDAVRVALVDAVRVAVVDAVRVAVVAAERTLELPNVRFIVAGWRVAVDCVLTRVRVPLVLMAS